MNKLDISKYIDLEMEFNRCGAGAYMISPELVITMLETESEMTCEDIKDNIMNSETASSKAARVYKNRITELLSIIDNMISANEGNDVSKRRIKELSRHYDFMINESGHVYYNDLDRMLNPLIYNVTRLKSILTKSNGTDNLVRESNLDDEGCPANHLLQEFGETPDEGMITLTDRQKRELLKGMNDTKVIQLYL